MCIVKVILCDSYSIFIVFVKLKGEYGLDDICLSVFCLVFKDGIEKVFVVNLSEEE